eukprot:3072575-Rhodomonas_salina.6
MSGTDAVGLRTCYAMSGTELADGAIWAYAHATRCPVLSSRMQVESVPPLSRTAEGCVDLLSMLLRPCVYVPTKTLNMLLRL